MPGAPMHVILPPRFHAHADAGAWAEAACSDITGLLRNALRGASPDASGNAGGARLLLSGGSTPGPVYVALARQALDWSKICVGLVDERWVPVGDADSNGRLASETLLQGAAAAARFEPLLHAGRTLEDCVALANATAAGAPAAIALLGMGPDGHTASIFPGMRDIDAALAAHDDYLAVDADGCPGAGAWRQRITLGAAGLARAAQRVLLIRGQAKRALFQQALDGDDVCALPIRLAFHGATPLRVHWCP